MIKGVIFDLDGVIADTAKLHFKAWKSMASKLGIEIDEKFNETLKGVSRMDSLKKIIHYGGQTGKYSEEKLKQLAKSKNDEYVMLLDEITQRDILPGIAAFIDELLENNIKLSLASASMNAKIILEKLNLLDKFSYIADPSKVSKGKPAPDIFIEACKGINLEISEVVGIEDSEAGVQSMKNCNMKSVGIGVDADITLSCTDELKLDKIK